MKALFDAASVLLQELAPTACMRPRPSGEGVDQSLGLLSSLEGS